MQEFPLWTRLAAPRGGSGEVKLSCIENTDGFICLVSMEMNAYHCVHNQKGPRVNRSPPRSSHRGALLVLDLSLCDYVIFEHLCPSDLTHEEFDLASLRVFNEQGDCSGTRSHSLVLSDAVHSSSSYFQFKLAELNFVFSAERLPWAPPLPGCLVLPQTA